MESVVGVGCPPPVDIDRPSGSWQSGRFADGPLTVISSHVLSSLPRLQFPFPLPGDWARTVLWGLVPTVSSPGKVAPQYRLGRLYGLGRDGDISFNKTAGCTRCG